MKLLMDPTRQITINFTKVIIRFKDASRRVLKSVFNIRMEFELISVLWQQITTDCLMLFMIRDFFVGTGHVQFV